MFLKLFLDDKIFNGFLNKIFDFATYNYYNSIFSMNFNEETDQGVIENFLKNYEEPEPIATKSKLFLNITARKPELPS